MECQSVYLSNYTVVIGNVYIYFAVYTNVMDIHIITFLFTQLTLIFSIFFIYLYNCDRN